MNIFLFFIFSFLFNIACSSEEVYSEEETLVRVSPRIKTHNSFFPTRYSLPLHDFCGWVLEKVKMCRCSEEKNRQLSTVPRKVSAIAFPQEISKAILFNLDPLSLSNLLKTSTEFYCLLNENFWVAYNQKLSFDISLVTISTLRFFPPFQKTASPHRAAVAHYLYVVGLENEDDSLIEKSSQLGLRKATELLSLKRGKEPHSSSPFCNCGRCQELRKMPEYYWCETLY